MPTLLIVDDDAVDREAARRCLRQIDGLKIAECEDGRAALQAIEDRQPDLVVTDLRMPRLGGLDLVREVGSRFPLIPVILTTSKGNERLAVEALTAGAASYVPKGDLDEILPEVVTQMLGVAAARRDQEKVLRHITSRETRFELGNDPVLIAPLVAYLQDDLGRIGFGEEAVRSRIGTALMEALSNAMIHGNLEVSSSLRRESSNGYREMVEERRRTEPWASRKVLCVAEQRPGRVRYVIRDEGPGFDTTSLPDPTRPESMLRAEGRGLFLIHAFMDEVEHNEAGNEIRLVKRA
ncbi:MAG: response regulator [Thermoanaerobaculia bacterium]|nr:response regulator [Thermoanaerobaculia bacterium]